MFIGSYSIGRDSEESLLHFIKINISLRILASEQFCGIANPTSKYSKGIKGNRETRYAVTLD
ncbi:MAG: hypothetical protein QXE19_05245 [Candidatus Bathyarchaeia archaeon]